MIALSTWSSITPDLVDRQFQVAFEQPFQNLLMLIFLWAMVHAIILRTVVRDACSCLPRLLIVSPYTMHC
jgi:succinate dehydrogenase hydrophobic anchor subunit